MGDIVGQDHAYTLEILPELLRMYQQKWNELSYDIPLHSICSCMFLLITCLEEAGEVLKQSRQILVLYDITS